MTALQMRSEFFREVGPILDSEVAMQKVITFVRTLALAEPSMDKSVKGASVSPRNKWASVHSSASSGWDAHKAWNLLSQRQREDADKLHLGSEDMDERTFSIITKHMR